MRSPALWSGVVVARARAGPAAARAPINTPTRDKCTLQRVFFNEMHDFCKLCLASSPFILVSKSLKHKISFVKGSPHLQSNKKQEKL